MHYARHLSVAYLLLHFMFSYDPVGSAVLADLDDHHAWAETQPHPDSRIDWDGLIDRMLMSALPFKALIVSHDVTSLCFIIIFIQICCLGSTGSFMLFWESILYIFSLRDL